MIDKIYKGITQPQKIPPYLRNKYSKTRFTVNRALGHDRKSISINGYNSEFITKTYADAKYIDNFSEVEVVADFLQRLSTEDVFWDVGANIGIYSCFGGNFGAGVVSFEPDDPTRSSLEDNLDLNGIEGLVLSYGLSDKNETLDRELNMQRENALTTVESVPGDEIIRENITPSPTVIKIDIEGMEYSALRGLSDTLNEVRLIYVEIHPEYLLEQDESAEGVKELLERKEFELSTIPYSNGNPIIRGVNK